MHQDRPSSHSRSIKTKAKFYFGSQIFFVAATGFVINTSLSSLGINSMAVRSFVAICASYLFFILTFHFFAKLFRNSVQSSVHNISTEMPSPDKRQEIELVSSHLDKGGLFTSVTDFLDAPSFTSLILILPLGLLVFIFYKMSAEGTSLLIDSSADVLLSFSLVRASRKVNSVRQYGEIVNRSFVIFLTFIILSVAVCFFAQRSCPSQNRLFDIMNQCWIGTN